MVVFSLDATKLEWRPYLHSLVGSIMSSFTTAVVMCACVCGFVCMANAVFCLAFAAMYKNEGYSYAQAANFLNLLFKEEMYAPEGRRYRSRCLVSIALFIAFSLTAYLAASFASPPRKDVACPLQAGRQRHGSSRALGKGKVSGGQSRRRGGGHLPLAVNRRAVAAERTNQGASLIASRVAVC